MAQLHSVIQILKKEHARLTRELKGITAALAAFGDAYGSNNGGEGESLLQDARELQRLNEHGGLRREAARTML